MRVAFLVCAFVLFSASGQAGDFAEIYERYQEAFAAGDVPQALDLARRTHAAAIEEYGAESQAAAASAYNIGFLLRMAGARDPQEAAAWFVKSAEIFQRLHGKDAPELIDPLWDLAQLQIMGLELDEAERNIRRVERILKRNETLPAHLPVGTAIERANIALWRHNLRQASAHLSRAEERLQDVAEPERTFLAGKIALIRGKSALAERDFRQAVPHLEAAVASLAEDPRLRLIARGHLVEALEQSGRGEEATFQLVEIARARGDVKEAAEYLPIFRGDPIYPRRAAEARRGGFVLVSLTVTAEGRVADPVVVESAPQGWFEEAALKAVRRFRYAPQIENGEPVPTEGVVYRFTFEIAK